MPTAPKLYANLGGAVGLVRSDPAWAQLTPDTPLGFSFCTSALVMANDSPEAFVNTRDKHDQISRSGVREWQPGDSDVVLFVSEPSGPFPPRAPPAEPGSGSSGNEPRSPDGRSPRGGSPGRRGSGGGRIARSLVHVGGSGYHLPPCVTVTLVNIEDKFKAFNKTVRRRVRARSDGTRPPTFG